MKKLLKSGVHLLAFAIIAGCATQPVAIPSFLAPTFASMNLTNVASISYQDEQGRPISEDKFATQFMSGRNFVATKKARNDLPDVTLRLRYGHADDNKRKVVESFSDGRTPLPGMIADVRTCAPIYPASELRARHTGTVMLNFLIGTEGQVKKAEIQTSSGFPGLDEAAMVSLSRCRFVPATANGVVVEKWWPVKYVWSIQ
jgi:TonB family protein